MDCKEMALSRRNILICMLGAMTPWATSFGQSPDVAYPFYSAQDVLRGLYKHHLPKLVRAFETEAEALQRLANSRCQDRSSLKALREQWSLTLQAWQRLATPGLGPVLKRRSQRKIDFWPTRPALVDKALAKGPQVLDDLATVGTPAKGFPALELLLSREPDAKTCQYVSLLTQDIAFEAKALSEEFAQLANNDWDDSEEDAKLQFAEWINQWLGGWERLRWTQIEQPILKGQTRSEPPVFARKTMPTNHDEWGTQLSALLSQARWSEALPPRPGVEMIPIEALLRGKGHLSTATRWGQALDGVKQAFDQLTPLSPSSQWLAFAKKMKSVTTLYQNEVAQALDIPLGFSDADGD